MIKNRTSDYIEFDTAMRRGEKLLIDPKRKIIGLYIVVAINTGRRYSDLINFTWEDLRKDEFLIEEVKTGKKTKITVNDNIKNGLKFVDTGQIGLIFLSQKKTIYSSQHIGRELKEVFRDLKIKGLNISSHSLRKSFGRRVWELNGESEKSLIYLSDLFNHSSIKTTIIYLGIRSEELRNIYLNL